MVGGVGSRAVGVVGCGAVGVVIVGVGVGGYQGCKEKEQKTRHDD